MEQKTRLQFSPEVREHAVRELRERRQNHPSRWAAIVAVAAEIGSTPQTLDNWAKQADRRSGHGVDVAGSTRGARRPSSVRKASLLDRDGLAAEDRERLRSLELEIQELRQENARLRGGTPIPVDGIVEPELDRREAILLVASRNFLRKGYSATSIDEIAEAAGTTGPALYRFFNSKQEILDDICLIGSRKKLKGLQDAVEKGRGDPKQTLHDLIENRIEFALSPWGCQVPISEAEAQHLSPTAKTQIETAAEINQVEWFKYLFQVRPERTTREILSIISAVIMEITYVSHHLAELELQEDIRPILHRLAWTGLMS